MKRSLIAVALALLVGSAVARADTDKKQTRWVKLVTGLELTRVVAAAP